jgi:hypothetical protein
MGSIIIKWHLRLLWTCASYLISVNYVVMQFVVQGVGKLWHTQFEANLELHIVSKVATRKISLILNNFLNHI